MSYKVVVASEFAKETKRIAKKHIGIKSDIAKLVADLAIDPTMGTELGHNFYKIRMSIWGTNKGKSGGARVITYVIIDQETVLLTEIYLKSEHDTANVNPTIKRPGIDLIPCHPVLFFCITGDIAHNSFCESF